MKKEVILFSFAFFISLNAFAYDVDVIITKTREQIQCIILSQTEELITYRQVDDESKIYTLNKNEVEKVFLRGNEQVASSVLKPEPAPVATKGIEIRIDEEAEPEVVKIIEPEVQMYEETKEAVEAKIPNVEQKSDPVKKQEVSPKAEQNFQQFMNTMKGPDMEKLTEEQAEKARKDEILKQNFISVFVTGIEENQADIQQIIESEIFSKLSTIKDHKTRIDISPKGISEDSIVGIAKDSLSKYALIISARPFQEQYYLQSKLINATNGEYLLTLSAASSLVTLEDVLEATGKLTNQIVEYFQEKNLQNKDSDKQETKQKENSSNTSNDTYTLEIVNMKNYFSRVVVAGKIVGVANPWSTQRFTVSVNLYGKVQIIQNTGYTVYPSESTYYIPQQSRNAVLTLTKD